MSYLAKYKKSDFKKLNWDKYGAILEKLSKKVNKHVRENNIKIDAVVPILRGGAFPGTYLAFRLHLLKILPVQYKYFFVGENIELRKVLPLPKTEFGQNCPPTFLLVENNHCFGLTAETAARDLKDEFPSCHIIYAADTMDYSYQKNDHADAIIYGELTNDTRGIDEKEAKKKGLTNKMHLFPWEDLEEEWTTIQGKQYHYEDEDRVASLAALKTSFHL